jgi:hypothetical protein
MRLLLWLILVSNDRRKMTLSSSACNKASLRPGCPAGDDPEIDLKVAALALAELGR